MSDERQKTGLSGEQLAERYLRKQGCKIVTRRFAAAGGEIDLVARDSETLVFVEVKCRRDENWTEPQYAVNATKRSRMAKAARAFIHARRAENMPCRFDVVAVVLPDIGPPKIEHFADAFQPGKG